MGPRFTSRDWQGIKPPVDAAMVGRVSLNPKPTSPPPMRRRSQRRRKPSKNRAQRGRQKRYVLFDDLLGYDDLFDYDDRDIVVETPTRQDKSTPIQNVYFFKRGMNTFTVICIPKSCCILTEQKTEAELQ